MWLARSVPSGRWQTYRACAGDWTRFCSRKRQPANSQWTNARRLLLSHAILGPDTVSEGGVPLSARTRVIGGFAAVLVGMGTLALPGGATAAPDAPGGSSFTPGGACAGWTYLPVTGPRGVSPSRP